MQKISTCQLCAESFIVKPGAYGKFCSLSCSTKQKNLHSREKKNSEYQKNPTLCTHCRSALPYNKKSYKFCSRSCSASTANLVPGRKHGPTAKEKYPYSKVVFKFCYYANKWYSNKNSTGTTRQISPFVKTAKEKYYANAKFKFNVFNYPEEFDLPLLEKHGWYSCPGKKRKYDTKNITGVSRDHIISVSYGFANNIDPAIISHPANCKIMLHEENKQKHSKCGITIEELLLKISAWNQKYGERCIGLEPTTSCLEGKCSTN